MEVQLRAFLNVDSGGNEQFLRPGSIIRPVRSVQVPTGSDIGWADMNTVWKTIISGLIGNRTSIRSASWGGGGQVSNVDRNSVTRHFDLSMLRNAQADGRLYPACCSKGTGMSSPVIRRPDVTLSTNLYLAALLLYLTPHRTA